MRLEHDVEWLAIVKATHELLSRSDRVAPLPAEVRLVTAEDKAWCVRACVRASTLACRWACDDYRGEARMYVFVVCK